VTEGRQILLIVLLLGVISALTFFVLHEPSLSSFAMALFLIVIWAPVKGVLFRRLGGKKPYWSALAANASSELVGLPFHLALSFFPLMAASFLITGAIETLTLFVMGTAATFKRCLFIGLYGSLVVHLISTGWFASHRSLTLGIPFIVVGIVLFHLPALYSDRFIEASGS
jgi:hypothetical protein